MPINNGLKSEKSLQQRTFPAYLLSKALDKAKNG